MLAVLGFAVIAGVAAVVLVAILVFKARQWFVGLFTGRCRPEPPARQDRKVIDVQYEIVDRRKDDVRSRPALARQHDHWKPSITKCWPVMKQGSEVARKATSWAMSAGVPRRFEHDALLHLLAARAGQAVAELGLDHAGADRVDHDLGPELLGQRPGEAQDAGLGRGIGVLADGAGHAARQRIERRHAGDAPARLLLQHDRRDGMDVVEAALQIDRDGAVELLLLDLQDALGVGRAGIVQQEVDACPIAAATSSTTSWARANEATSAW